jgi:hypothetical protein
MAAVDNDRPRRQGFKCRRANIDIRAWRGWGLIVGEGHAIVVDWTLARSHFAVWTLALWTLDFLYEGQLFVQNLQLSVAGGVVVVIVQAQLAPGDAFGMRCGLDETAPIDRFIGVKRVDAGAEPEVFMIGRKFACREAIVAGGRDGNGTAHTCISRVLQNLRRPPCEFLGCEMAMGVNHAQNLETARDGCCDVDRRDFVMWRPT